MGLARRAGPTAPAFCVELPFCDIIRRMSLPIAILFAAAGAVAGGTARITSGSAYYDHKEGYAYFSDRVAVDDAEYQLHADRAYVFMDGTNALERVVAIGRVAMTNGTKRAYGDKASYYRQSGMVVLTASEKEPAEVRDEAKGGAQIVRGKKIKFWIGTRQVEVQEAWISAPTSGSARDGIKGLLGR